MKSGPKPKQINYITDEKGCHVCTSHAMDRDGYIQISINGKSKKLHRLILEEKLGRPIKENYCACHTCDNPSCINPEHLFEGTNADNMQDRDNKGRWKHTEKQMITQKNFIAISPTGEKFLSYNQRDFARQHDLDQSHLKDCLKGYSKKHKGWTFHYANKENNL